MSPAHSDGGRVDVQATTHIVGESAPQNAKDSVKFSLPAQIISLGLLADDEPVLWQFDEEIGLPVVSHMEYFGEMLGEYGQPDMRENGRTTTLPKTYTAYAHGGGHPQVNFTRDDVLGFFAPESKIANDFPRLYVGTYDDYQRLVRGNNDGGPPGGSPRIIWGKPYKRPVFAPSQQKYVREVCIVYPGEKTFRTTYPATEGWVRSEKLLGRFSMSASSVPSQRTADDD